MVHGDAAHPDPFLQARLEALFALHRTKTVDLTIRAPYLALLAKLGDPHRRLPPVIHVAGTNGKGSTVAFMRAMLEEAGQRVHVYTSPHLLRFNERIVLAGREIDDRTLAALLDDAVALNDGGEVTFFEMTTAIAFAAFARAAADVVLLETGLGGRLDCTNVVERPAATVITAIGYDHMDFLGDTLPSIALEKAGIMKPGVPCIVAPQPYAEVEGVLVEAARTRGAPLLLHGRDWYHAPQADGGCTVTVNGATIPLPPPALTGRHQVANAATAACAIAAIRPDLAAEILARGVALARWPARLQKLDRVGGEALPDGLHAWFDGGHNRDAALVLADFLAGRRRAGDAIYLIVGMLNRRDLATFLRPLRPFVDTLTAIPLPDAESGHDPATIRAAGLAAGFAPVQLFEAPNPAAAVAALPPARPATALITGSFYLAPAVA